MYMQIFNMAQTSEILYQCHRGM